MRLRQISNRINENLSGNIDEFELQKKAEDAAGGDNKQKVIIANQMKEQEKLLKQNDIDRQKRLRPEFNKINTSVSKLNSNVKSGKQDAQKNLVRFNNIDNDADNITNSVNNIKSSI